MNDAASRTIERLSRATDTIDVHQEMIAATFQIIHSTMLSGGDGVIDEQRAAGAIETILETVGKPDPLDLLGAPAGLPRPWGRKARRAVRQIQDDAQLVINHRRNKSELGDDLLGLMLSAKDPKTGEQLTNTEIRDNLLTFIAAGHETTALALTWSFYLLALHPEWQEALNNEIKMVCGDSDIGPNELKKFILTEQVINEAMRLYPPAPAIDRIATEDISFNGIDINKGDFIVIGIMPLHRHQSLWNNPDSFDPSRFSSDQVKARHRYGFIPFSGGPRVCIGLRFAMMEAIIILAKLVRAFKFSIVNETPVQLVSRITLRPEGGMQMEITKR
jgi:cytochrome P450